MIVVMVVTVVMVCLCMCVCVCGCVCMVAASTICQEAVETRPWITRMNPRRWIVLWSRKPCSKVKCKRIGLDNCTSGQWRIWKGRFWAERKPVDGHRLCSQPHKRLDKLRYYPFVFANQCVYRDRVVPHLRSW